MTTYTVSSGVTSTGLLLVAGDTETVLSGGTAINTGVDGSGATQIIDAGGTASNTTVDLDSLEEEQSGGTTVGTVINSGGEATVNGLASGTVVTSAGLDAVYGGGIEIGATLSGGLQIVGVSGTASGTLIVDGGSQAVGEGSAGTVTGTVVDDGVQQIGGSVTYEYFYGGGIAETVNLSGGVATGTTVSGANAEQTVSTGGTAISTTVEGFGVEYVYSGGTASNTTIDADSIGAEGGTAVGTVVNSAGEEETTGIASGSVVNSGGLEAVYNGGTEVGATLSGGIQIVGVSGTTSGVVVSSGGAQYVGEGSAGTVTGTVVSAGGTQQVGGSVTYTYYYSGGVSKTVNLSGGAASDTTVSSGGTENVDAGGVAIDTTVISSAFVNVASGGEISGASVEDDAVARVSAGGIAISTTVSGNSTNAGDIYIDGGSASGTQIGNIGVEFVYAGGTATGTTVSSGGVEVVTSGGSTTNELVLNGGQERVYVSASTTSTTLSSGGKETVSSGGTTDATSIFNGGIEAVSAGGTADNTYLSGNSTNAADIYIDGGSASGTRIDNLGVQFVYAGGTDTGTTISSGGVNVITSGGSATNDLILNGGQERVYVSGSVVSATISSGGVLVVSSGGSATDTILQSGGTIDVGYVPYVAGATATLNSSTDLLTVTDGTNTLTYQMAGSYTGDTFLVSKDSANQTQITLTPCFCAGTHILTDRGEILVELLAAGDRVITADGTPRPIKWVGHRDLDLSRHADPELAQPIRIRAGAMGDNTPHRDLYVSPDHALLLNDLLVPARLLVNAASIQTVSTCKTVTYYHVELETHDILVAENLPAESYLDTGNRGMFENGDTALILHPDLTNDQARRVGQSCRPFADAPALVEPIWHRLAQRSADLGLGLPAAIRTTDDPALHVVIGGRTIRPLSRQGRRYVFMLPPTEAPIQLVSRATSPNSQRPWVEDRRRLGVMVSGLTLKQGANVDVIPLDHPLLSLGWWDIEADRSSQWRWTDGAATIPAIPGAPALLEVTVAHTLDYPLAEPAATGLTRAA